jgi:hypothetical protein
VQVSTVATLFVIVYHYFIKDFLHVGGAFVMGISLCTWSLWGWFFSQHLGLLLEQLGQ